MYNSPCPLKKWHSLPITELSIKRNDKLYEKGGGGGGSASEL